MTTPNALAVRGPAPDTRVAVEPAARIYELKSPISTILTSDEARAQIAPYLRHGISLDSFIVEAYHAAVKNPDILKCTRASIISAVSHCVAVGLVIGKTIHLVPQHVKVSKRDEPERKEWQLDAWTDYKGDIELVVRSGAARLVDTQCVYANDSFEFQRGDDPWVRHSHALDMKSRGALIGGYCIAYITQTLKKITVMSLSEVEKIRAKSRAWNPKNYPECPPWYVEKSTVHKNTKTLPKNERLAQVLALFERQDRLDHGGEDDLLPAGRVDEAGVRSLPAGVAPESLDSGATPQPPAEAPAPAATAPAAAAPAAPAAQASASAEPECPTCGGRMWDNRPKKASGEFKPNAPDYKCRDRACDGKYWPGQWPKAAEEGQGTLDDEMAF